jgi:hypothetical protein
MMNTSATTTTKQRVASTVSLPRVLLHLEGLTVFIGAVLLYGHLHASGLLFAVLILAPDLSMIGYAKSVRMGSLTYNAVHTYSVPSLLMLVSLIAGIEPGVHIALIWYAHIGMDRLMGFGLKYPTEFKDTHLNHV